MCYKLFYRNDCHLCEDMHSLLQAYKVSHNITIKMINVDQNSLLQEQYGQLVPVLTDTHDNEICHYFFDKIAFELTLGA